MSLVQMLWVTGSWICQNILPYSAILILARTVILWTILAFFWCHDWQIARQIASAITISMWTRLVTYIWWETGWKTQTKIWTERMKQRKLVSMILKIWIGMSLFDFIHHDKSFLSNELFICLLSFWNVSYLWTMHIYIYIILLNVI